MNYKPIWHIGPTEVGSNAQVFATHEEAFQSAKARFNDWTTPTDFGVETTSEPVNYVRINNQDERI